MITTHLFFFFFGQPLPMAAPNMQGQTLGAFETETIAHGRAAVTTSKGGLHRTISPGIARTIAKA